jgi:hypothetical protein
MKTFQQFNEDLRKLQRGLEALERESAPRQRLAARRSAARQRSRDIEVQHKKKTETEALRRKKALERLRRRTEDS